MTHMMEHSNETFSPAMKDAVNYNRWVVSSFEPDIGLSVLEIGVGHGGFFELMPKQVQAYAGVDIDPKLISHAKSLNPGKSYYVGDLASPTFSDSIENRKFDTVLCLNVLEHIEDDAMAMKNMLNALTPGGKLLLFVPAFQALYSDLDHLAGHFRRYTKGMLSPLVPQDKGVILKCDYFNSIGGVGWWLNKFKKHEDFSDRWVGSQIRFFDRYVLPLSRMLNPLTRGFFGQSLICVVEKK